MTKLTENLIQQRLKTRATDIDKVLQINVTGRGLEDISLLRKLTRVEVLSLSVNQISGLADFQNCKNLRELHLRHNRISDINEIFYLKNLPKLELLTLSQNPCAVHPLYRMTVIKNLKTLTELDGISIGSEERKQAQKLGEDIFQLTEPTDSPENCIPNGLQLCRTSTNTKLKPSGECINEFEFNASQPMEKIETTQVVGRKAAVEDSNVKMISSTQTNKNKGKQQSPKSSTKYIPLIGEPSSGSGFFCRMCGNNGSEFVHHPGMFAKNSNILSATLKLIQELDYPSLQIVSAEVGSRITASEANYVYQCHTLPNRNGTVREIMHVKPYA